MQTETVPSEVTAWAEASSGRAWAVQEAERIYTE